MVEALTTHLTPFFKELQLIIWSRRRIVDGDITAFTAGTGIGNAN